MLNKPLNSRTLLVVELAIALAFCVLPLFYNNPYRLNIFLSWEGAYRLYSGQTPFVDFKLPMGYGYWVIPALFFKIFGPYMYSLIISQVFINIAGVLAFRSILKILNVRPEVILLSVVVFCFSYVSFNFWPWYNHLVIILQLVAMYFALAAIFKPGGRTSTTYIVLSVFFLWFSIFTKQDGGIIATFIVGGMFAYDALVQKSWRKLLMFILLFVLFGLVLIVPLLKYDFTYWFNYGQEPHDSRIHLMDFLNNIVGWAYWEKFFLLVSVLFVINKFNTEENFLINRKAFLFSYVAFAILLEALVIQVTSDEPENGEAFFYAFAFAYCIENIPLSFNLSRPQFIAIFLCLITFWWTGIYWRNIKRIIANKPVVVAKMESKAQHKYRLAKEFKTLEHLYLSESTIEGIHKIKGLDVFKTKKNPQVLNMSELTSLAYEIPFEPLKGQPMWFHQGVSIFQKEVDEFCNKIRNKEYDVVIFETIPSVEVINFFPMDVKACLDREYTHRFTFLAPRTPEHSYIDVYTKPQ
jgi:hypothetical protein